MTANGTNGSAPHVTLDVSPAPSASTNRFSSLVKRARTAVVDSFTLESGEELKQVEVAYQVCQQIVVDADLQTWGCLNDAADNAMVICHALTGSSDVEDWCAFSVSSLIDQVGTAYGP